MLRHTPNPPLHSGPACIASRSLSTSCYLGFVQRLGAGGAGELQSLGRIMGISLTLIASFSLLHSLGFSQEPRSPMILIGQTSLSNEASLADLNARAMNTHSSDSDRARAVFTLFALHISPGSSSETVRSVLGNSSWLRKAQIRLIDHVAGLLPVAMNDQDTVFALSLFPNEESAHPASWVIYFRLTGKLNTGEALLFFTGPTKFKRTELAEFALCFPNGRIEGFSKFGLHVLQP